MAHHELEQGVVAGGERAALARHHLERRAGLERRQRDQAGASDERDQERQRGAGDVEERPAVEVAVIGPDPEPQPNRPGVAQHVVVGEHDRFRIGGRARGELDEQQVARLDRCGQRIERAVRHALAQRKDVLEALACGRDLVSEHDQVAQQRQGVARQRAVDGGLGRAQERQKVDAEKAVGE